MWSKPEFAEINMSAEIGAYQDDSEDRDEAPILTCPSWDVSSPLDP
jgi:coenzyme PQQ precursor peptide PqqA